eukprot:SAG11_NODE_2743_length_3020_cov_1.882574_1_plen_175_part_00
MRDSEIVSTFGRLDANSDGMLSIDELSSGLPQLTRRLIDADTGTSLGMASIAARGALFRNGLEPEDVLQLEVGQALFQCSLFVPAFLYHICRVSDDPPRLPCTISWTIRRGAPRYAQHVLWLAGWCDYPARHCHSHTSSLHLFISNMQTMARCAYVLADIQHRFTLGTSAGRWF